MRPMRWPETLSILLVAFSPVAAVTSEAKPCGADIAVPMTLERTGHASVQLVLNAIATRVLVDTGANVNTLDATEGRRLNPVVVPYEGSKAGEGSATMSVVAEGVPLGQQRFSVMDLFFINIPSKRYGTEPFSGQLGASFFTDFKARIDFGEMVLCIVPPPKE